VALGRKPPFKLEPYVCGWHAESCSWGITGAARCDPQAHVPDIEADTRSWRVPSGESVLCCGEERKEHKMTMHQCWDGPARHTSTRKRSVRVVSLCLLVTFLAGCSSTGTFPQTSGTQVDLSRKNFRVVKANAVGSSTGFKLFGFIPFAAPRYTTAMSHLYKKAGIAEGKAQTLTNVTQERSNLYLVLFSLPKLTVRADIIEFTE
jgi:hypothetical protein